MRNFSTLFGCCIIDCFFTAIVCREALPLVSACVRAVAQTVTYLLAFLTARSMRACALFAIPPPGMVPYHFDYLAQGLAFQPYAAVLH